MIRNQFKEMLKVVEDLDPRIPFVGFERGYFLDIQSFFPTKQLIGHKILSGQCNLRCYYCHRRDFLESSYPLTPIGEILSNLREREFHNTIVVTGGEITLHYAAAIEIMKRLRKEAITTLFSTNGAFPDRVEQMAEFSDVVKIDVKGHESQYRQITGHEIYHSVMKSIGIASRITNIEVKLILHDFTQPQQINQILKDVHEATGMPVNLAVQFQPVRDFLKLGIAEPRIERVMEVCATAEPLPDITLLKHYGEKERIYRLEHREWQVYREKEIPLRFNWSRSDGL